MNSKHRILLLLLLTMPLLSSAQQLFLEAGKTVASFDYKDSQGMTLDNLQATNHTFMNLGYRTSIFTEKLKTSLGLGYFGYGAIGNDASVQGIMTWDVDYLELSGSLDYSLFTFKKIEVIAKGVFSTGFFIQGTQGLNNEIVNLKNTDDFNTAMLSLKAGFGLIHPVSEDLSFYVQYLYGKSFNQSNSGDNESLKINSHNIGFGVLIALFGPTQ